MTRARYVFALLVALSFTAAPPGGPLTAPTAQGAPLVQVVESEIEVLVPKEWRVHRIGAAHRRGVQASLNEFEKRRSRAVGMEIYWVDAAKLGVPSDYYYLAARGPAMSRFAGKRCQKTSQHVALDDRPRFDHRRESPGTFVAVSSGTCESKRRGHRTRWTSFVAAPGFGAVKRIGIPSSGMYSATVMVEDSPRAQEDLERLVASIRFGGTSVAQFLAAAEAAGHPL